MNIEFYSVKAREKVSVPLSAVRKKTYTKETKTGAVQTRYALVAKHDGSSLTKFVSKADFDAVKAPPA